MTDDVKKQPVESDPDAEVEVVKNDPVPEDDPEAPNTEDPEK